jgi:hypothetical protein
MNIIDHHRSIIGVMYLFHPPSAGLQMVRSITVVVLLLFHPPKAGCVQAPIDMENGRRLSIPANKKS